MRFYNRQHRHYCGIDLHVKTMYVCILDGAGQVLVHRNVAATPTAFLEIVARTGTIWSLPPSACSRGTGSRTSAPRKDPVRARARAGHEGDPRGQGEERQARLAQDRDAAARRPPATGVCLSGGDALDPDLLRRRLHLVRKRGQLLADIQNTRAQYVPGVRAPARLSGQS